MEKPTWAGDHNLKAVVSLVDDYKSVLSQYCITTVFYGVRKSRTSVENHQENKNNSQAENTIQTSEVSS